MRERDTERDREGERVRKSHVCPFRGTVGKKV